MGIVRYRIKGRKKPNKWKLTDYGRYTKKMERRKRR